MANIWVLSLLFPIFVLVATFKYKNRRQHHRKPPSPPGFPIIGNLHQIGELPHQSLWKLSKKYGPVMLLKLGKVPTVVVSSSETARQALKLHDLHCCSRPSLAGSRKLSYNYVDITFSPYDDYWKEVRKLAVRELFSTKQVHSIQPIKDEEVKKLIISIAESASKKSLINLNKTFLTLTVSVICRTAFGVSFEGTVLNSDSFNKLVRETVEMLGSFSASDFIPYVGWIIDWLTGLQGRRERSFRDLDAFYEQMIELHKEEKKQGTEDFVDLLLKLEREEALLGNEKLTRNHIKAILMDIFLAGVNTSATTILWAMTELIRNPNVMKKVQDEIRTTLGENREKVTEQDLNQLNYFKLVIKETFRLHPTAPLLLPRETLSQVKIQGYDIPSKTQMMVNVYAIARDPKLWEEPDEFKPERFVDSSVDYRGLNFELLPFGSGRRICPGMTMGIVMVELGLLNLLYFFDWVLPQGKTVQDVDMEEEGAVIVSKKVALELVPIRRR
ncbi:unnamed protein product [Cochlearia groenlandica]